MKTNRILALTLMVTTLFTVAAFAQGSGSGGRQPSPTSGVPRDESAFTVTRTVKGTIADLNLEERRLVVEDKKGKRHSLKVSDETRYKADKKTQLAEKKDLALRDFQAGQLVRVLYRPEDETALEVRLAKK